MKRALEVVQITLDRKKKSTAVIVAIVLQVVVLALTVWVVVLVPTEEEEPAFVAKKTIYLPQKDLEHQAAVSAFQQAASSPMAIDHLTTAALLPDSLPAMPVLPAQAFSEFDNPEQLAGAERLLGHSGMLGQLQGLHASASNISFLGIEDAASRVVIAFDVSTSVVNNMEKAGLSLNRVKQETIKLIKGLNANTLFAVVQFVRAYEQQETYLMPATVLNKAATVDWLDQKFGKTRRTRSWQRGDPDGIQSVLEVCFAMQPDVVFILSDGSFQTTTSSGGSRTIPWNELNATIQRLQSNLPKDARVHFISFGAKQRDHEEMQQSALLFGGVYRAF